MEVLFEDEGHDHILTKNTQGSMLRGKHCTSTEQLSTRQV